MWRRFLRFANKSTRLDSSDSVRLVAILRLGSKMLVQDMLLLGSVECGSFRKSKERTKCGRCFLGLVSRVVAVELVGIFSYSDSSNGIISSFCSVFCSEYLEKLGGECVANVLDSLEWLVLCEVSLICTLEENFNYGNDLEGKECRENRVEKM